MGTNLWKKVKLLQTLENIKSQLKEGRRQTESPKLGRPQSEEEKRRCPLKKMNAEPQLCSHGNITSSQAVTHTGSCSWYSCFSRLRWQLKKEEQYRAQGLKICWNLTSSKSLPSLASDLAHLVIVELVSRSQHVSCESMHVFPSAVNPETSDNDLALTWTLKDWHGFLRMCPPFFLLCTLHFSEYMKHVSLCLVSPCLL